MNTRRTVTVSCLLLATALFSWGSASAQDPDIRDIRPVVMLLADTSGSMEFTPGCTCTSPSCSECEPDCGALEQNRWAVVLQALTGEWTPFECSPEVRVAAKYIGKYDHGYFLRHFNLPHEIATYAGTQGTNGILDNYLERIKFGLMTFDSTGVLLYSLPLVLQTTFEVAPIFTNYQRAAGMFSYGERKPFTFPAGTPDIYMIDNGARRKNITDEPGTGATEGGLVSVGNDSMYTLQNPKVQSTLLGGPAATPALRPYGAGPTAAMMDDLQYYLANDDDVKPFSAGAGDIYYNCRARAAILITDGSPNGDMRDNPVECEDLGQPVGPTGCPYELTEDKVDEMVDDELDKLYVIGFTLEDAGEQATLESELNEIADNGGTEEAAFVSTREELYNAIAEILDELNPGSTSRTAPVLTGASPGLPEHQFLSGFNPSFSATDPWDGVLERRRYECIVGPGGPVPELQPVEDKDKFHEVLNDQSAAPAGVEPFSAEEGVSDTVYDFDSGLSRNLWTVLPVDPADIDENLAGNGEQKLLDVTPLAMPIPPPGSIAYIRDVEPAALTDAIPETYFGVATTSERDDIVNFVHGEAGTDREDQRLGAIYHSTPFIVGPLASNVSDESFNSFRNVPDVGNPFQLSPDPDDDLSLDGWSLSARPRILYAASNDGILHAFLTDDGPAVGTAPSEFACVEGLVAGTELWGFLPPVVLDNLKDLDDGGVDYLLDGNIIVKNLIDVRNLDSGLLQKVNNVWRTVLFMNVRNEAASFALDITNPCKPEFLWQFTGDADLAPTYGQPVATQVFLEATGDYERQERAVIIIPGGGDESTVDTGTASCAAVGDALPNDIQWSDLSAVTPRANRRCWCATGDPAPCDPSQASGRALYFLDMITGELIRKLDDTVFPAPLNSGLSVFRGGIGQIGSAVYLADADGVLWRVLISDPDPDEWSAIAFHDIFHDGAVDAAESSRNYNPPVLSADINGNVVILHGTGNIDVLDDAAAINKVVSLTEKLTFDPTDAGEITNIEGQLNWEITLNPGEQVTGPLTLFSGSLFFGTFQASGPSATDACPFDGSRIFGVSFLESPTSPRNPEEKLTDILGNPTTNLDSADIPRLATTLVIGLQVAQVPTCVTTTTTPGPDIVDPFLGITRPNLPLPTQSSPREFRLIAHLSGAETGVGGSSFDVLDEAMPQLITQTIISDFVESAE